MRSRARAARLFVVVTLLFAVSAPAADDWVDLFSGKNLDGWEAVGDGVWTVMRDGTLVGQRDPKSFASLNPWPATRKDFLPWLYTQAWLYTQKEFGEFDLRLDYWAPHGANSGVSIRDTSRAKYAVSNPPDFNRTPSRIGYEIQINNGYPDPIPTGSIYRFAQARTGFQIDNDWNTLEIESRNEGIRVKLNGHLVAEHPGDPARPKVGPIGLQLHDQFSVMMFRNIRIRELR